MSVPLQYALTTGEKPNTIRSLSSLTVSGGVASGVTSVPHGWLTGARVKVDGATPAALNGVKGITVTGASTFVFTASGVSDGAATGTITAFMVVQAGCCRPTLLLDQDTGRLLVGATVSSSSASLLTSSTPDIGRVALTGSAQQLPDLEYTALMIRGDVDFDIGTSPSSLTVSYTADVWYALNPPLLTKGNMNNYYVNGAVGNYLNYIRQY